MPEKTIESLEKRLLRAQKAKAVLAERSEQLQRQIEDFRHREDTMSHVSTELLERQRELNFMLHRASSVLHQLQDTNLALSAEFSHIVKELPAASQSNWEDTVSRVNDLFKKTHDLADDMQDEIFGTITDSPKPPKTQETTSEAETLDMHVEQTCEAETMEEHIEQSCEAETVEEHIEQDSVDNSDADSSEAQDAEAAHARRMEAIDRLFPNLDSESEEIEPEPERQGFFARLLGKDSSQ